MRFCVILLLCIVSSTLACNNYCNGHGKCGVNDKCECFMGWGGADCSLRSCPYDDAFVDIPLGDINHNGKVGSEDALDEWRPKGGIAEDLSDYVTSTRAHRYAECSNAGKCDRTKGECECFEGYEGSACQRRSCPSSAEGKVCSGHGSCLTSTTIIHDNGGSYYGWESEKYLSCLCDSGWEGIDCSMRTCPKGFDPVVLSGVTFNYRIVGGASGANGLGDVVKADFYFQFAYDGMVYETPIISKIATYPQCKDGKLDGTVDSSTLSQITENIRRSIVSNVPYLNQATVSFVCGNEGQVGSGSKVEDNKGADLLISMNQGDVKKFGVNTNKLTVYKSDGTSSTPSVNGVIITANHEVITYTPSSDEITITDGDPKAYALCSRRGTCQSETGECKCFDGYSGEACQTQRSIAL